MTREDKQLLLKDLCGRLPYGVKVQCITKSARIAGALPLTETLNTVLYGYVKEDNIELKPYLRPMSSMTEEEIKTYRILQDTACSYHYEFGDIVDDFLYFDNDVSLDYLNSIHIDYRGLIEKGLALEAKEGMYKTE